ncbi:MAG: EF-hand domain-containing protein [Akkermansiaceae bacterium]
MKNTILLAGIIATVTFAQAGDKSIGDGTLPEFLQQFDTNEDGLIDEEERQAMRELRQKRREEQRSSIDADGDGELSREEIEAAREAIRAKIEERRNARFLEIAGENEVIDHEEFVSIPGIERVPKHICEAIFARLDRDESGVIDLVEFTYRLRRHHPSRGPKEPGKDDEDEGDNKGPQGP